MSYTIEKVARLLKSAREKKGISQRDLSKLSGVPQSHLSKIERNGVDLRITSLVEIAHALELELVLVPRKAVPVVQSIVRSLDQNDPHDTSRPAYQLEDDDD